MHIRRIFVLYLLLVSMVSHAQLLKGTVLDAKTKQPLPYVQIGVAGKDAGLISHENGEFQIDLSKVEKTDSLRFYMAGYKLERILIQEINPSNFKIELRQASKRLREVVIKGKEIVELKKMGRTKPSKTTMGQSGREEFGYGREWGLKILNEDKTYRVQNVNFHLRFNTVDSILFRVNFYRIKNDMPGDAILDNAIFVTSHTKENWIRKTIEAENIIIHEDIIVTFEPVRIWYSRTGGNYIFFTYGEGYTEGRTYSRKSSFAPWEIDHWPPATFYLTGRIY